MEQKRYEADVVIVGGGVAGIAAAIELLDANRSVVLLDRDIPERFGGLAKESFGGMFFVGTPQQRRMGFDDSPDLALSDWREFAEFGQADQWPLRWAEMYVHQCKSEVYNWLHDLGVRFFPVVHWVERGLHTPGNSGPRFHMVWGTGYELIAKVVNRLRRHRNVDKLQLCFQHHVNAIDTQAGAIAGVHGVNEASGSFFEARADNVIIASGGICGDIERVKANWYASWGQPPKTILNGSHRYADGDMHDLAAGLEAHVTHLDKQWHYAAGIHHPDPKDMPGKGLSVIPPRSALWVNYRGERFKPMPLMTGFDTRYLVEQVCRQSEKYSWMIMNWKIACKELAVSGSEFNDAIREKRPIGFLKSILMGSGPLVNRLTSDCQDFVTGHSIEELVDKMNALPGVSGVDLLALQDAVTRYDQNITRGPRFHNDEQLRRIAQLRQYRGDRVRTCKFQKIVDERAMPLIAMRSFILSRKSLGGIQTDLESRVLTTPIAGRQRVIDGLYAVGEAAGFGGGGAHGLRALEGTFLGLCVMGGRLAAQSIAGKRDGSTSQESVAYSD